MVAAKVGAQVQRFTSKLLMGVAQGVKQNVQEKLTKTLMESTIMKKILTKLHEKILKSRDYQKNKLRLRNSMMRIFQYYSDNMRSEEVIREKIGEIRKCYDEDDSMSDFINFAKKIREMQVQQTMQAGANAQQKADVNMFGSNLGTNRQSVFNSQNMERWAQLAPLRILSMMHEWDKMGKVGKAFSEKLLGLLALEKIITQHGASELYHGKPLNVLEQPNGRLGKQVIDTKMDELLELLDNEIMNFLKEMMEKEFVSAAVQSITKHLARATIEKALDAWYRSATENLKNHLQQVYKNMEAMQKAEIDQAAAGGGGGGALQTTGMSGPQIAHMSAAGQASVAMARKLDSVGKQLGLNTNGGDSSSSSSGGDQAGQANTSEPQINMQLDGMDTSNVSGQDQIGQAAGGAHDLQQQAGGGAAPAQQPVGQPATGAASSGQAPAAAAAAAGAANSGSTSDDDAPPLKRTDSDTVSTYKDAVQEAEKEEQKNEEKVRNTHPEDLDKNTDVKMPNGSTAKLGAAEAHMSGEVVQQSDKGGWAFLPDNDANNYAQKYAQGKATGGPQRDGAVATAVCKTKGIPYRDFAYDPPYGSDPKPQYDASGNLMRDEAGNVIPAARRRYLPGVPEYGSELVMDGDANTGYPDGHAIKVNQRGEDAQGNPIWERDDSGLHCATPGQCNADSSLQCVKQMMEKDPKFAQNMGGIKLDNAGDFNQYVANSIRNNPDFKQRYTSQCATCNCCGTRLLGATKADATLGELAAENKNPVAEGALTGGSSASGTQTPTLQPSASETDENETKSDEDTAAALATAATGGASDDHDGDPGAELRDETGRDNSLRENYGPTEESETYNNSKSKAQTRAENLPIEAEKARTAREQKQLADREKLKDEARANGKPEPEWDDSSASKGFGFEENKNQLEKLFKEQKIQNYPENAKPKGNFRYDRVQEGTASESAKWVESEETTDQRSMWMVSDQEREQRIQHYDAELNDLAQRAGVDRDELEKEVDIWYDIHEKDENLKPGPKESQQRARNYIETQQQTEEGKAAVDMATKLLREQRRAKGDYFGSLRGNDKLDYTAPAYDGCVFNPTKIPVQGVRVSQNTAAFVFSDQVNTVQSSAVEFAADDNKVNELMHIDTIPHVQYTPTTSGGAPLASTLTTEDGTQVANPTWNAYGLTDADSDPANAPSLFERGVLQTSGAQPANINMGNQQTVFSPMTSKSGKKKLRNYAQHATQAGLPDRNEGRMITLDNRRMAALQTGEIGKVRSNILNVNHLWGHRRQPTDANPITPAERARNRQTQAMGIIWDSMNQWNKFSNPSGGRETLITGVPETYTPHNRYPLQQRQNKGTTETFVEFGKKRNT
ncbi:unnamed protein product [Amoebophrya sp. A120]|nr:unnamed protein product [Amoebophrya sp. A120]|eukprot:GSA120T00014659001.1